jgi:transmembrane sensor
VNSEPKGPSRERASAKKIEAAAAEWVARQDAGLTDAEQAQFQQWLAASQRHAAAWQEIQSVWRAFDRPRQAGEAGRMVRELTRRRRRRHRRAWLASAAAIVVLAAAWPLSRRVSPLAPKAGPAEVAVAVSKPERRQLVDGSVVELKAGAEIEVHFSAGRRDVTLVRGEAHFAVAKDRSRPFVVATPWGEARAVGTAFSVEFDEQAMAVLVTEGTVAVRQPAAVSQSVPVSAGSAVIVPAAGPPDSTLHVEQVTPGEIEQRLAWRAPRIDLMNTPLGGVVEAFNRENQVQLAVADAALARLRLTGVFRADRPEEFVRLLEAHYGVRTERRGLNTIVLHSEP